MMSTVLTEVRSSLEMPPTMKARPETVMMLSSRSESMVPS